MAWYPGSGSGSDDDDDEPTSIQTQLTEVVPPVSEHEQTRIHRRSNEDDPTIARPALSRAGVPAPTRAPGEPDEPTVEDDDPTVNRKALTLTEPAVELLDQRYQLLGQLGAGGMGEVWRARHVQLARDVAIKFLTNDEGGPRFRQEAQAIAAVRHTGVVSVLDFGETDQAVPYFVMELIEGETLSARVRRQGPLSWALVRNIALEISDALAHAHGAGIIHRDLKPSNVLVLDAPPPRGSSTKLIDFGIAKLLDDAMPKLTKKGFIQGTPAYMSPEQVLGEPVDPRADVYGLGCLLYFLLSGQRPFADKKGTAALRAQVNESPPRFAEIAPDQSVPPDVESIVFRAMAKDKTARFASMLELHQAILAIPPDAGASLSMKRVPASRASASASLRTTASYSASYDDLNSADASSSASMSGSMSGSGSQGSSMSRPNALEPASNSSGSSGKAGSSASEKLKLSLAVAGSLLLIIAAITALVWALTS